MVVDDEPRNVSADGRPSPFADVAAVAAYADNAAKMVPGLRDLYRMAELLLAERVPFDGRVLVVGAGGGLELKAFAERHAEWRFDGVDPSPEMLALAAQTLGSFSTHARLQVGTVADASDGPFDGATCLLTLHFLPEAERLRTLTEIRRRLAPGAPFVMAHHSFPQGLLDKPRWLDRFAAFAAASGMPIEQARKAAAGVGARLPALDPDADEALLRKAGFIGVELFYAAFSFRGWIGYRDSGPSALTVQGPRGVAPLQACPS